MSFVHSNIVDLDATYPNPMGERLLDDMGDSPSLMLSGPQRTSVGKGRRPGVVGPQVPGGPPKRPRQFKSVQQLHNYLEALRDYYAVLGRPR